MPGPVIADAIRTILGLAGLPETMATTRAARRYLEDVREPLMLGRDAVLKVLPELVREELAKDLGLLVGAK